MKKHLQFNDITALSLGWRAARRKAERERRGEREKEQSSSSLLCIFIKENITSFPLLFSFLSPFAFLSHSFTFCSFLSFSPLCSLLPFSPPVASHHPLPIVSPDPSARPIHVFFYLFFFYLEEAVYPTMYLSSFFFFSRAPLPTPPHPNSLSVPYSECRGSADGIKRSNRHRDRTGDGGRRCWGRRSHPSAGCDGAVPCGRWGEPSDGDTERGTGEGGGVRGVGRALVRG